MGSHDTSPVPVGRLLTWCAAASGAGAVVALATAHAPDRIRLLGLFALAIGLLAGCGLGQLGRVLRVPAPRAIGVLASVLIALTLAGAGYETHRLKAAALRLDLQQHPPQIDPLVVEFERVAATVPPDETPAERATREQVRAELQRSKALREQQEQARRERLQFSGYLRQRISALGNWSLPAALTAWLTEIAVASIAGGYVASRWVRDQFCTVCDVWLAPVATYVLPATSPHVAATQVDGTRVAGTEVAPGNAPTTAADLLDEVSVQLQFQVPPTTPAGSRVALVCHGCRCPDVVPVVTATLETPGGGRLPLPLVQPSAAVWRELRGRLASSAGLH